MIRRKLLKILGATAAVLSIAYVTQRVRLRDANRYGTAAPDGSDHPILTDAKTALVLVDPYNDFFSSNGAAWLCPTRFPPIWPNTILPITTIPWLRSYRILPADSW